MVTVPATLFALSNGALCRDKTSGDKRTLHWRLDVPHSLLPDHARGRRLRHDRDQVARRPGRLLRRARPRGRRRAHARAHARDARAVLEEVRRPLPVPALRAGLRRRLHLRRHGEHQRDDADRHRAARRARRARLRRRRARRARARAPVVRRPPHLPRLVEGWLNEGFATYFEYVWREHHEGRDAADLELEDWAEQYFGEDAGRYRRPIATKLYDEPIDIFDRHLYEKGGRVLHMLRAPARRRRVLQGARALPRQAPPRARRDARPRARRRGGDRQGRSTGSSTSG